MLIENLIYCSQTTNRIDNYNVQHVAILTYFGKAYSLFDEMCKEHLSVATRGRHLSAVTRPRDVEETACVWLFQGV